MRLSRVSFLVIDDNEHMRRLVRLILRSMGSDLVREALNGSDALQQIEDDTPDIIITDWVMDPIDGIALTRHIRRSPKSPNIFMPIIMMTGYAERDRVATARDTGVNEFLVKPLSAGAIYSRIQAVIEKPRQFVRIGPFFGPDRRRRRERWTGEDRRGHQTSATSPAPPPLRTTMTQRQINSLFNP